MVAFCCYEHQQKFLLFDMHGFGEIREETFSATRLMICMCCLDYSLGATSLKKLRVTDIISAVTDADRIRKPYVMTKLFFVFFVFYHTGSTVSVLHFLAVSSFHLSFVFLN